MTFRIINITPTEPYILLYSSLDQINLPNCKQHTDNIMNFFSQFKNYLLKIKNLKFKFSEISMICNLNPLKIRIISKYISNFFENNKIFNFSIPQIIAYSIRLWISEFLDNQSLEKIKRLLESIFKIKLNSKIIYPFIYNDFIKLRIKESISFFKLLPSPEFITKSQQLYLQISYSKQIHIIVGDPYS